MGLRNLVRAKLVAAIENSPFTVADFEVNFGEKDDDLMRIIFRHNREWRFAISVGGFPRGVRITESPGEHRKVEEYAIDSFDDAPARLSNWCSNVRTELRANVPIYSELDALRKALDEHVASHVSEPSNLFTTEEADELRAKLDDFVVKLEEMQNANQVTEQEVKRLEKEVSALKENLNSFPKGTWLKTSAVKLWVAVGKIVSSPEGRKVLTGVAEKALGLPPPNP